MNKLHCRLCGFLLAVLAFVPHREAHAQAQATRYAQIARFKAASVILEKVVGEVGSFKYPQVNTADIPELVSPYSNLLIEITDTLRRNDAVSQRQLAELGFFCGTGITNLKSLVLREMRALLLPQNPGDTPDRLRVVHSVAVAFFSEQAALVEILPSILECQRAER